MLFSRLKELSLNQEANFLGNFPFRLLPDIPVCAISTQWLRLAGNPPWKELWTNFVLDWALKVILTEENWPEKGEVSNMRRQYTHQTLQVKA